MMSKFPPSLPLRNGLFVAIGAILLAPGVAMAQQAQQPPQPQQQQDEPATLDAVSVSAEYIPEPLLQSSSVISVVTQADFERTGDSDAAQALQRVSGLSLVSDKFVYVRGLGERYSSALLNGSPLPSPEPLQRVVPLDLFPAEVLQGVTVQKTYSVRYPGEFGGGVIDLKSLTVPEESFLKLSVNGGLNSLTTHSKGLTYYGDDHDFWGYDDGRRDLPEGVINSRQPVLSTNYGHDPQIIRDFGRAMNDPNQYLLQQKNNIDPDVGFGGSAGTSFDLGGSVKLGIVAVGSFENTWRTRTGLQQDAEFFNGDVNYLNSYDFASTRDNARVNGLLGLGLKSEKHSLTWTTLYVHDTLKEAKSRHGFDVGIGGAVGDDVRRDDYTLWLERELVNHQLSGEHSFGEYGDVIVEWRAATSEANRTTPFETHVQYSNAGGAWITGGFPINDFAFGAVDDYVDSAGVDVTWNLPTEERALTLSFGGAYSKNDREAVKRVFDFVPVSGTGLPLFNQYQRIEYLLSDWNLQNDVLVLREKTANNNGESAYDASLDIRSAYLQLEGEIATNLRGSLGFRYEDAVQEVRTLDIFSGVPITGIYSAPALENDYILPALAITWNIADNQQLRFGASKTIARPQFRELAPQQYTDPDIDRLFFGNPFLVDSELVNLDLRYERYFDEGEYLTAGLFHKSIENPVEAVTSGGGGNATFQSFLNAPEASLYGIEVEFKKYFDGVTWGDNRLYLATNYTWTKSEVSVGANDTVIPPGFNGMPQPAASFVVDGSAMQGQSDHIGNLQIGVESADGGFQTTLIANYVGERIVARGRPGQPDYIDKPGTTLDFVLRKRFKDFFGWNWFKPSLKLTGRNLLGTDHEEFMARGGDRVDIYTYSPGVSWNLSVSLDF